MAKARGDSDGWMKKIPRCRDGEMLKWRDGEMWECRN